MSSIASKTIQVRANIRQHPSICVNIHPYPSISVNTIYDDDDHLWRGNYSRSRMGLGLRVKVKG